MSKNVNKVNLNLNFNSHQCKANFIFTSLADVIRIRLANSSHYGAYQIVIFKYIVSVIVDRIVKRDQKSVTILTE